MKKHPAIWASSAAILAVSVFMLAAPAPAQVFVNHNSNAPVDFNAGRIEVQDRADRVVLSGAVRVEQAGLVLNAARMTVAYSNSGGIDVNRIDASGGVTIRKSGDTARGNVAIYDLNRRLITLVGNVTLQQGNGNRAFKDAPAHALWHRGVNLAPGCDGINHQ